MGVSDFLDLMPDTVTVEPFAGRDGYGKPTYGAPVQVRARVSYKPQIVHGTDGKEVVARGAVWLASVSTDVSTEDRLTLPGGEAVRIVSVEKHSDGSGLHHIKVLFG